MDLMLQITDDYISKYESRFSKGLARIQDIWFKKNYNSKYEEFVSDTTTDYPYKLVSLIKFGDIYYNATPCKINLSHFWNKWGKVSAVINEYSWNVGTELWLKTIWWEDLDLFLFLTDEKPSQLILNWPKRLTQRIWFKAHHSEAANWLPFSEDVLQNSAKKSSVN